MPGISHTRATASGIRSTKISSGSSGVALTMIFICPHKKYSRLDKSADQGGQGTDPPTSIHCALNVAFSSGMLIIDEPMLRHINNCTEEEAHRQLGENEWSTTLDEPDAFISIVHVRGRYVD
ncbi:hypothetical protein TNCV_4260241 [Trichonephila clavipes]|nr:hypothetical protein TNCV_4260241 [Trichonephila clavipes]